MRKLFKHLANVIKMVLPSSITLKFPFINVTFATSLFIPLRLEGFCFICHLHFQTTSLYIQEQ